MQEDFSSEVKTHWYDKISIPWLIVGLVVLILIAVLVGYFLIYTQIEKTPLDVAEKEGIETIKEEAEETLPAVAIAEAEEMNEGREIWGPSNLSPNGKSIAISFSDSQEEDGLPWGSSYLIKYVLGSERATVLDRHRGIVGGTDGVSNDKMELVKDLSLSELWHVVGWSVDGKKIYFVTSVEPTGLGGNYPSFSLGYSNLYEFDVDSAIQWPFAIKKDVLLENKGCFAMMSGIKDVYSEKGKAVLAGGKKVSLYDFKSKTTEVVAELQKDVMFVVLNSDVSKIGVITHIGLGESQQLGGHDYRISVVDLKTKKVKELKALKNTGIVDIYWKNNKTLVVEEYAGTGPKGEWKKPIIWEFDVK